MFNLQGGELIIILLLALVVLGPEKLPEAMRKAGQAYAELKKMSSGFQSEFRAAVDEPLREIRETANVLRDSADFTKLQNGEREEKPKSAEMAPAGAEADPVDATPTFDTPSDSGGSPARSADSEPAPFDDEPSESGTIPPSAPITSRSASTAMSSTSIGHEAEPAIEMAPIETAAIETSEAVIPADPTPNPSPVEPAASGDDDRHGGADGEPDTDR